MAQSIDWPRDLARATLTFALAVLPTVLCVAVLEGFDQPKLVLLLIAAAILVGLAIWETARSRIQRPRIDVLGVGVVGLVGASIVSAIFGLSPRSSFFGTPFSSAGVLTFVGYAAIFFAVRRLRPGPAELRWLTVACLPAATAIIGYTLVQRFGLDPITWEKDHLARAFGTLGHPNHLAGYLAMVLPIFAVVGLEAMRRRDRLALAGAAIVGSAGVWVLIETVCRTGWLAFAAASIVLGLLLAAGRLSRRMCLIGGVVALSLLVGSGTWLLVRHGSADGERASGASFVLRTGTWDSRVAMWDVCARIFARYPLTGCGTDNLQLAFGADRTIEYARIDPMTTPHRAHNMAVHLAATQGSLGLIAGFVLLVGIAMTVAAVVRSMSRPPESNAQTCARTWSAAAIAGLVAFAVNGMLSYTPLAIGVPVVVFAALLSVRAREPAADTAEAMAVRPGYRWGLSLALVAIPLLLLLNFAETLTPPGWGVFLIAAIGIGGLAWRWLRVPGGERGSARDGSGDPCYEFAALTSRGRAVVFASWLVLAFCIWSFVVVPFWAQRLWRYGLTLSGRDLKGMAATLEEATAWTPSDAGLWASLADAELELARTTADSRRKLAHLDAALRAANETVRLSPHDSHRRGSLMSARRLQAILGPGSWEPALAEMDEILAQDPNNLGFRFDAVELAFAANDLVRLRRWAEMAYDLFPKYGEFAGALGHVELYAGNNVAARKWFEEAWAGEWPDRNHIRLSTGANLLVAYKRLGEDERLCSLAAEILRIWPGCREVRQLNAEALARRGEMSAAREQFEELRRRAGQ